MTAMKGLQSDSHERLATRQPSKACKVIAAKGLQDGSHSGLALLQPLRAFQKSHGRLDGVVFFHSANDQCHRKCHGIRVTIASAWRA